MKNLPNKIYLQAEEPITDFNELSEVTWCADRINENDIEYELYSAGEEVYVEVSADSELPQKRNEPDIVVSEYVHVKYKPNIFKDVKFGRSRYNHKFNYWGDNDGREIDTWLKKLTLPTVSEEEMISLIKNWMEEYNECHTHEDVHSVCQEYYFKFKELLNR